MRAPGRAPRPLPFPHSPDHALTVRCRRAGERHTGVRIRVKYSSHARPHHRRSRRDLAGCRGRRLGAAGAPAVGVAFGGGSARGIAHIGVIQWFEEHHVPIDVAAGTSMGGLVGGAFATGMSAAELRALITGDRLGRDVRQLVVPVQERAPQGRRAQLSRRGSSSDSSAASSPPTSLNDGQQVDFLLARIAAPYYALAAVRRSADAVPRRRRRSARRARRS